jgi:hypothetical protein
MFAQHPTAKLRVHTHCQHKTLTIAHRVGVQPFACVIGPLQNEQIDIGETLPARCLRLGVRLVQHRAAPFAFVLSPAVRFGHREVTHIELERWFGRRLVIEGMWFRQRAWTLRTPRPVTRPQTRQCAAGRHDPARKDLRAPRSERRRVRAGPKQRWPCPGLLSARVESANAKGRLSSTSKTAASLICGSLM